MIEVKPYKKMMIFSHDDLDGIMAPVILSCFLDQAATLTVKHCKTGKYGTIDAEITAFLSQEDASSYNGICVTDLVPSDEVMADLHAFAKNFRHRVESVRSPPNGRTFDVSLPWRGVRVPPT